MHPGDFAEKEPDRPAVIMGTAGTVVTYAGGQDPPRPPARAIRRGGEAFRPTYRA